MKPALKVEVIKRKYWACHDDTHRHQTEAIAQACIDKQAAITARRAGRQQRTDADLKALLARHRGGARQSDLARELGLSREYTRQLLAKAKRTEEREQLPSFSKLKGLNTRAKNCLLAENLDTLEDIRGAAASGYLDGIPNLGEKTKREILAWLDAVDRGAVTP